MPIAPNRPINKGIYEKAVEEQSERLQDIRKEYDNLIGKKITGSYSAREKKGKDKRNRIKEILKEDEHLSNLLDKNREILKKNK